MGLGHLLFFRIVHDARLPSSKSRKGGNCKRWVDTPTTHGKFLVSTMIQRLIDHDGGYLFDDISLNDDSGLPTSHIDHIYISRRGVFFISTITDSGTYMGTDSNDAWIHILGENESEVIKSPVLANEDYINQFAKAFGPIKCPVNVVLFANSNISKVMSRFTMPMMNFPNYCIRMPVVLGNDEIYELAAKIVTLTKEESGK